MIIDAQPQESWQRGEALSLLGQWLALTRSEPPKAVEGRLQESVQLLQRLSGGHGDDRMLVDGPMDDGSMVDVLLEATVALARFADEQYKLIVDKTLTAGNTKQRRTQNNGEKKEEEGEEEKVMMMMMMMVMKRRKRRRRRRGEEEEEEGEQEEKTDEIKTVEYDDNWRTSR